MQRGILNELKIANSYNNKKFKNLTEFQKGLIETLFGKCKEDDIITSGLLSEMYKPDIYLKIGDRIKYVSIKSRRADSIHFEGIKSFILFLRSKGISLKTQKIILLFHYGDGTLDGSGETRFEFNNVLAKMSNLIDEANEEINTSELVHECLFRFLFQGFRKDEPCVDIVYYGDEKYGAYAKRDHIINFVANKRYEHIKTLHIGPMSIQPYLRDTLKVSKHPEKREQIQVKWHYLLTDIEYTNNMASWKHWK